jgi:hypothetical protein
MHEREKYRNFTSLYYFDLNLAISGDGIRASFDLHFLITFQLNDNKVNYNLSLIRDRIGKFRMETRASW